MKSVVSPDVLKALDAKIAEVEKEMEEAKRAAERLPTLSTNVHMLRHSRALLAGERESKPSTTPEVKPAIDTVFSPGSIGAISLEVFREAGGGPLHIKELTARINAKGKKASIATVWGAFARYVKQGKFRRVAPSVYGLPNGT